MSEEKNTKNKTFVGGAIVLGIAGLVVKILGAAFRIPLGNIIGSDGMGYYQTAYPIYNLFLTLAIAGIPTAIARLVAERYAVDRPAAAHKVFRTSFILLLCTGIITSSILFFGAGFITKIILEPDAVYCMKAIAPALFFCPLMSSFRGYFQGRQNMRPTATSQVAEQIFRVALGLGLSVYLLDRGLPVAAAGASFGATAGGLFGFISIALIYLASRKSIMRELSRSHETEEESTASIIKDILVIAIPITIGSAVLPIINTIDTAIVKSRLVSIGYDFDVARSLYGELTGMAAPLINFPQVLTQAVSMSLVPLVASAYKRKETDFMRSSIALGLRYALIISLPCAIGMSVLAKPIMLLLYPMQRASAESASACLTILAISVIFLGCVHTMTGILQGIGKQMVPVKNLVIGALAKIVVTFVLTGIPSLNVRGAAFGTLTAYCVAAVLDFLAVIKYTGTRFDYKLTVLKPLVSSLVMGAGALGAYTLASKVLGNALSTALGIGAGVIIYAVMIFVTGTLTMAELEGMPKGKKIASLLRRLPLFKNR